MFITFVFKLSEKAYVTLCFSLKVGRSAMACFRLLSVAYWVRYGNHLHIQYGTGLTVFILLLLLLIIMVCDLYFDSYILDVLIISLILIIFIVSIVYSERVLSIFPHP